MKRKSQNSLKEYAENIAVLRHSTGLSQRDASLLCGLSKNVWASVEKAERPLPKPAFELFCRKIGISIPEWYQHRAIIPSKTEVSRADPGSLPKLDGLTDSEKLEALRAYLQIDIRKAARYGGLSEKRWEEMEAGTAQVSAPAIELLCHKFGIESAVWVVKTAYIYDKGESSIVEI